MSKSSDPPVSDTEVNESRQDNDVSGEYNTRSVMTIIGASLTAFCTSGFFNAFGVLIDYYQTHQLSDRSTFDITWLGSFGSFMLFISFVPAGILFDRMGPTILLIFGAILLLFSMFMISLCKEYYQFFLAQGTLLGVGQAFLACPAIAAINLHFIKHRGLAMGVTIAGSSLGGVIWPIVLNCLLNEDRVSFGWTIRIVAFIMMAPTIFACVAVRNPAADDGRVAGTSEKPKKEMDLSIIKNPTFLTYTAGLGIYYLGMFSPQYFVTTYAVSIGTSTSFAYYLVSILNAASLVGRVSGGWLSDKYGCFNLTSLAALSSAVVAFCWTAVHSQAGLVVWSLAYGFVSGCIMNFQTQCAAKLATPTTYGTAIGLTMGIVSVTGLFGAPISGELLKYGYLALSMYVGATLIAGGVLISAARLQLSRKLWEKV